MPIFHSSQQSPGEPGHPERSGQTVTIIREYNADEIDREEVGPMFRIRFEDGVETDAFYDELEGAPRPAHYAEYDGIPEIAPGVFVSAGDAVYIVDDRGEVMSWNCDEAADDEYAFTAALNAVALAVKHGAAAVRQNIDDAGDTLDKMILATATEVDNAYSVA
jgi:hypothetical protein